MPMIVHRVHLREIEGMRDIYRHEMNCQVIHDSIHARPGWTHEYLITTGGLPEEGAHPPHALPGLALLWHCHLVFGLIRILGGGRMTHRQSSERRF
jgi:hypothetical protein